MRSRDPGPDSAHSAVRSPPRRMLDQKGEPTNQPAGKPDSSVNPILNAAVKVLHEALKTR